MKNLYLSLIALLCSFSSFATVGPVTGNPALCVGLTTALSDTSASGTWSSDNAGVANVDGTGLVTGYTAGTATIDYTTGLGVSSVVVTVNPNPTPILGTLALCDGTVTTLTDATVGGTWSSSTPIVAISSGSGMVTGISSGTAVITYTLPTGCITTAVVTINALPAPISGSFYTCVGTSSSLSDATAGGTWSSSSSSIVSVGSATGLAIGVSVGVAHITYALPATGCYVTGLMTNNLVPSPIAGTLSVCPGWTFVLTDVVGGGTWTSSNTAVASIMSVGGTAQALTAGTTVITYQMATACFVTTVLTVNPGVSAITGVTGICSGTSTSLTDATPGGTWSNSNPSIASVDASGNVIGIATGTTVITYAMPSGCTATKIVSVNALPLISGQMATCVGQSTALSDVASGGTWSSSNLLVGSVSTTGAVTGVSSGSAFITYTLAAGCSAITLVTVTPAPSPIFGALSVCDGVPTTMSDAVSGGAWYSSNPGVYNINIGSGHGTGLTSGTSLITYSMGSPACSVTSTVTVNPLPGAILGTLTVCAGSSTTLTDSYPGGTWSSTTITVSSGGVVTGATPGIAIITYTSAAGCAATTIVTVNPIPPAITGATNFCVGATTTLTDAAAGGIWNSANTSVATVGAGTGVVTGISAGISGITYTLPTGCVITTTVAVIICTCSGTPSGGVAVTSDTSHCYGYPHTLSVSGVMTSSAFLFQWQTSPDGSTWTDLPGATTNIYTYTAPASLYYQCVITCIASGLTANSSPVHVTISNSIGAHSIISEADTACNAAHFYISTCGLSPDYNVTTYFGDGSSSNVALTTASLCHADVYHSYGSAGTYFVKQVLYNATTALDSITFSYEYLYCHTLPLKFYFDGNSNCTFDAGEFYNALSVSVEVDSNGTPIDTLTATSGLYYKALGPVGTVYGFSVLPLPGSLVVSCPSASTVYDTITTFSSYAAKYVGLNCGTSGGDFDLSVASSASSSTGRHTQKTNITVTNSTCSATAPVVTMVYDTKYSYDAPGYSSYLTSPLPTSVSGNTLTWNLSALSAGASQLITVWIERPTASGWLTPGDTVNTMISVSPIIGDINPGNNTITKTDTVKSSWDPNDIEVSPQGFVLPCTQLQYKINFENTGNDTAHNIYVLDTLSDNLDPRSLAIVTASATMNISMLTDGGYNVAKFDFPNVNLLDTSRRSNADGMVIFNINARTVLSDGSLIENRAGIYFDDNPVVMTNTVQNAIGISQISGSGNVCAGAFDTLIDASAGGVWSVTNSNTTIAGGVVTGMLSGLDTVNYTVSNSCTSRTAIQVIAVSAIPVPALITGSMNVCIGAITLLSDTTSTGTWTSGATSVATISGSGLVLGIIEGTATISYAVTNSCGTGVVSSVVSVNPLPYAGVISGAVSLCAGAGVTLSSTAGGGSWTSGSTGIATAGSAGDITGIAVGTATISYAFVNSCGTDVATYIETINAIPVAGTISGALDLCPGTAITLSSSSAGGSWSSASTGVATVSASGEVTGVAAGSAVISYSVSNDCGSDVATFTESVNPLPDAGVITGDTSLCVGATATLGSSAVGGSWNSGSATIASVGSAGDVTGLEGGTATISYSVGNTCGIAIATYNESIHDLVVPSVSIIPGDTLCEGIATTFTAVETGGGTSPVYQWTINGVDAGAGSFHTYTPANGDIVAVSLLSNAMCATPDSATSSFSVIAIPALLPIISISADPGYVISAGQVDTIRVSVANAGASPVYEWSVNGSVVPGVTSSVYFNTFSNHDSVSCRVTSNGLCGGYTSFNSVIINVNNTGIDQISGVHGLTIYPNPATNELNIAWDNYSTGDASVILSDIAGREVFKTTINIAKGQGHTSIDLPALQEGMYLVNIISTSGQYHSKLEIKK